MKLYLHPMTWFVAAPRCLQMELRQMAGQIFKIYYPNIYIWKFKAVLYALMAEKAITSNVSSFLNKNYIKKNESLLPGN